MASRTSHPDSHWRSDQDAAKLLCVVVVCGCDSQCPEQTVGTSSSTAGETVPEFVRVVVLVVVVLVVVVVVVCFWYGPRHRTYFYWGG